MRPQDFKFLGLNPLMHQYICPKHFTHTQAHLANQIDYFVEHGQLAEGAFLKKVYTKNKMRKYLLQSPSSEQDMFFGQEIVVQPESVQDNPSAVGLMQPLKEQYQESLESRKKPVGRCWDHDYSVTHA